jgi:hypothetical protein
VWGCGLDIKHDKASRVRINEPRAHQHKKMSLLWLRL